MVMRGVPLVEFWGTSCLLFLRRGRVFLVHLHIYKTVKIFQRKQTNAGGADESHNTPCPDSARESQQILLQNMLLFQ